MKSAHGCAGVRFGALAVAPRGLAGLPLRSGLAVAGVVVLSLDFGGLILLHLLEQEGRKRVRLLDQVLELLELAVRERAVVVRAEDVLRKRTTRGSGKRGIRMKSGSLRMKLMSPHLELLLVGTLSLLPKPLLLFQELGRSVLLIAYLLRVAHKP